jgi:hypothetical protein
MVAGFKRHDEILQEHSRELVRLREEMVAGFKRHDEELAKLREDMNRGFERHDRILERHESELIKLREDFNKMLEAIRELQRGEARLERRLDSLESAMISGFGELSKFAGITFEEFVRKFLTVSLRKAGEMPEDAELVRAVIDGEEINLFSERPLIVGEVTSYAESADEVNKLLRKADVVEARYGREPRKILVILTVRSEVLSEIRRIAEGKGIELISGRTVAEKDAPQSRLA